MRVRWGARALMQLRTAHAYLQSENPPAARAFLEAVERLVSLLGQFPRIGVQTDAKDVFVFPLVRFRYLIFYRVYRDEEVHILRIRHGARRR